MNSDARTEDRLPPLRGLVSTRNAKGKPFPLTAMQQWIRVCQSAFKVAKFDLRIGRNDVGVVAALVAFADSENLPVSIRCAHVPVEEEIQAWKRLGALDVFYAPESLSRDDLSTAVSRCRDAGLPLRVQMLSPLDSSLTPEGVVALTQDSTIFSMNIAIFDPFLATRPAKNADETDARLKDNEAMVLALHAAGVETNYFGVPFCGVSSDAWSTVMNYQQYFNHHQHYLHDAYELAVTLHAARPTAMATAIEHYLSARASLYHIIDRVAFPRIISHPKVHIKLWLLHKLTRKFRQRLRKNQPLVASTGAYEKRVEDLRLEMTRTLGPACGPCALNRICDHAPDPVPGLLPGFEKKPVAGDRVVSPLHFNAAQHKAFDAVDAARVQSLNCVEALGEAARRIVDHEPATREIKYDEYQIEGGHTDYLVGAVRWWSLSTDAYQSTPVATVEPPFTIGVMFGGGIADQVGFAFSPHIQILCPMIDANHHVALHVDRDGHYVLLRDGVAVRPSEFGGHFRVPERLGGVLHPRLTIWNIDGHIQTQNLRLWEHSGTKEHKPRDVKYSVIVPSTRYSRRLQALMLGVAHQPGYDLGKIEIIISYVPGLDSNDDLIDSMQAAFPELRVVRCTFPPVFQQSRGVMVNEAVRMASGEWVILFDSDIVVPPTFFADLDAIPEGTQFVAPDGRKMLPADTTAKILLGEIEPWEDFQAVLDGPGEIWHREAEGVPVGFCQIVRRRILEEIPYDLADNFEGSDWTFATRVLKRYGKEHRMPGVYVLHLDHGGSQWYGVRKQK